MAVALNTSHPLYANLVSLIGVDDDNVVKDFKVPGRTCTKHASATVGTGAYGRHVRTTQSAGDSQGVALSPQVPFGTYAAQNTSVFVVLNDLISTSGHSRAGLLGNVTRDFNAPTIQVNTSGQVSHNLGGSVGETFSTGNILTGAHSVAVTRTHQTSGQLILNGNAEVVNYGRLGNTDASNGFDQIGGFPTGNWGAVSADFVWVATFDKVLSEAEINDLHTSIGADNAFGLVGSAAPSANYTITTADATFAGGGVVRPIASFAITAGNTTFAGGAGPLISASFSANTASTTFAGGATGDVTQGTITCPALKNNTGTVLANETGITAYVYAVATGSLVATKTSQTTNASGVLAFTDAAIAAGTAYRVVVVLGSGAEGMDKVAAT